ncbi:hypothetical protein Glove_520g8 [Diversispora epigaea]|uniref:Uncharacterized protein n=1 Tax=Diversispora epigaea TaxID=1348612 RepID=A0A397GI94_9GLOM|nr:hypothetical protein Glove_520g8 [Diversispora epigaea]
MMWQYGNYIDGTVVLRIINVENISDTGDVVLIRQMLSLRIIYPNGTVSEIDKGLEIQEFNWQITTTSDGINQDPISIFALQRDNLLVRYFKASNTSDITTYEEWGRIIDWYGNLYSEVNLGGAYIQDGEWFPSVTTIVTNVDPSKGFIRIAGSNETYIEWQQYMIDNSFNLIKLSEGSITLPQNEAYAVLNTIATVDEGYSIIMGNTANSSNSNSNYPLEIYATVYDLKIGYNETQFSAPKLLYQSTLPNITLYDIVCGISSSGIGQVCALTIVQDVTQGNVTSSTNYYVKIDFLISGSVTKVTPLNNLPKLPSNTTSAWTLKSIPYGGYLIYGYFQNGSDQTVYGYYFNETENKYVNWDFSQPSVLNPKGILLILPNNTLLISQKESNNTWSFLTTDIPNYSGNIDNGYSNLLVNSTNPSINSSISNPSPSDMGNITITYYDPVELSDGNIWIYRIDNSVAQNITRQFVNANNYDFCFISEDGLTVTIKVIRSTFSYPNSQFYVKVDNNFVRSKVYGEPLKGINDNIWNFNTIPIKEDFASTASGVMRLTKEGTQYYETLNSTGQDDFFFDLIDELSKILSIDSKRLSSNKRTEVDDNIRPNRQIFICINIKSSRSEKSVKSIVDDLYYMIKYKSITSISLLPTTKYLDEEFGFKPRQNLWEEYRWRFVGVIFAFGILMLLFFLAHKKESQGRSMAVLQLGLIIFDFVMDSLFVSFNGKNVERLSSNKRTEVDDNIRPNRQIFICINIKSSRSEKSVKSIVDDLYYMIKYKSITSISLLPTTKYLDEEFGFKPRQNLWEEYRWRFVGVIFAFGILMLLFFLAHKKESQGRSMAVLQLGLIIFDFVMDSLFVSFNGKNVEVLYIPSIVFLIVPIVINTIWAFYIIFEENKSKLFMKWFTQYGKVVSLFTVLSGADIEALSILYSNVAGLKFFKAPFSPEGKGRIFWGSCLNIFLEDIPQMIIQILYLNRVVTYDIIPLLALVSSCLNLLINIVGRLFQTINLCRFGKKIWEQNQEEFGGIHGDVDLDGSTSHPNDVVKEEKGKNSEKK